MKRNVIQTLNKVNITLTFLLLAMLGWCILSNLAIGKLNHPFDHPSSPISNKEMCHNGKNYVFWAYVGPMGDR
jgi:hypothetical protein